MTANVELQTPSSSLPAIPLAALFEPQSAPGSGARVWVLDRGSQTVRSLAVEMGRMLPGDRVEVRGLQAGQQIVTAGVHRLREGEKVRSLSDEVPARSRARSSL
jgi:multidrug efflux system membrane fusion protein